MKYNLSSSQKIFINNIFDPMWNHGIICFFSKKYNYECINHALNSMVQTFETLRLHSDGNNVFLNNFSYCDYPFFAFDNKEDLYSFARDFVNKPYSKNEQMARFVIFKMQEISGILLGTHHLSVDGFSGVVAINYIRDYLKDISPDSIVRQSYSNYVLNENVYKETKRYFSDKKFWLQQFSVAPKCSIFEEMITSFDCVSDEINFHMYPALFNKIKAFCNNADISVQSFLNTVYSAYIYKTKGLESFSFGIPILNRTTEIEFNSGGLYMHIVPLFINISDDSFLQNALNLEDAQMDLFRHHKFTQYDIKELLKEEGKPQNNLFDIVTDYQVFEENKDYEFEFVYSNSLSLPLEIHMQSFGKEKHNLKIRYRTSMFSEKEIETMMNSFIAIAEDALENPEKKITELEMLSAEEKQKVLYDFNNTAVSYPKDKCIHELFEEQAEKTPDKVAVVATDKTLTYRELNEEANRIAHSLIERGVGKGDIVALLLPIKSSFLSALFGVLKAGAAYLPIDCDFPSERIEHILSDSNAKMCISEENFEDLLKNQSAINPDIITSVDDFCYCIYTSGSTGKAKGTLIYHRNLVWYMSALKGIYGTDNINMPFFTSQSVDLTVPSFYFPLLTGGTTYLYNRELKENLIDIFNNDNLTILKFTPTHMCIICNLVPDKLRPDIRCVIVGGESLGSESCYKFLKKFGEHIEIHNEYGPTETTVSCTDYVFSSKETDLYLPIGRPINNVQLYITDKYLNPTPVGVVGEICIAGAGVGAGYLNNPELTAEKFVDNPFGEGKLYKTGDNAYWREDGNIVFVGRSDFQVKINGQRIELGEIENTILSMDGVVHCATTVRKYGDKQYICAFYTGEEISSSNFRATLNTKLPKNMVPHIFTRLSEMPMTASGKTDRNALPEIDFKNILSETEYIVPETQEEQALAVAVCSVLGIDSVNMLDNFFNIGGDSIKAIYIVSELEDMGYELHVADIMQSDTLSDVTETMKSKSDKVVYDQGEIAGFVPFSPIMRAFLKGNDKIPKDYVHTCIISVDCDKDTARKALDSLISYHDMLRGTFGDNGIEICLSDEREVYSFNSIAIDDKNEAIEHLNNIKFDGDKLVNVVFCHTGEENLLSITVHHFLIDLVSWEVLIKDFCKIVDQFNNNEKISLPVKTASFIRWSDELEKYSENISQATKDYWNSVNTGLDTAKSLKSKEENENSAENYSFTFDKIISDKLINEVNNVFATRINEVLLTALGLAASKIAGGSVGIMVESHGRTELDKPIAIERTVGWFTSCYPVIINGYSNATDELISVKETLRRIPSCGIDYLLLTQGFHENADIKFNFYHNSNADKERENKLIKFEYADSVFPGIINVSCFVSDNILTISISVSKCKHKPDICKELGAEFVKQIENLVEICTETGTVIKTCSDFSDDELTEAELDELKELFDWTDDDEQ